MEEEEEEEEEEEVVNVSQSDGEVVSEGQSAARELEWLIGEMGRLARYEAGHNPKAAMKRTSVLGG